MCGTSGELLLGASTLMREVVHLDYVLGVWVLLSHSHV